MYSKPNNEIKYKHKCLTYITKYMCNIFLMDMMYCTVYLALTNSGQAFFPGVEWFPSAGALVLLVCTDQHSLETPKTVATMSLDI